MEPDVAELDSLDDVLCSMSPTERELAVIELEMDGLWDGRLLDNE